MKNFLLAIGLALLAVATGQAQVYELRTYTAEGDKLDDLHARFRHHTIRLLEKHGATNLGYWVPADNPDNRLVFLLSYPSQAARERTWATLVADPEWLRAKKASERRDGKLVESIETTFLTATAYSPPIRVGRDPQDREFELRTATAKDAEALHARLRTATLPELTRNGSEVVGVWTVQKAGDTTVMYLVARKPLVDTDSLLVSVGGVGMRRPAPRPDPSVLVLKPTDYSPMK